MSYLKISILLLFASQTACFIDTKVTEFNEMICKKDKDCFNGMLCVEPYGKCRVPNRCVASENGHTRAVSNGNSCFVESGEEGICLEGACVSSICGDGYADPKKGEKCDDGDTINENACTNTCAVAVCGDGIVFAGVEVCDGPQCNANCEKKQICGDGVLDDNEQCDDSNRNSNDACDLDCKIVSWKSQLIT